MRLSIVRYQPNSIDGCHLSKPTLCDFVQLTPERTTSISRTDDRHVRVVVSGPIGVRFAPSGSANETLPTTPADLEEWERLPGDTRDLGLFFQRPVWEQRLVYADELHL